MSGRQCAHSLAGGGRLPGQVAAAAHAAGRQVFLVGLEGFADPTVLAPWPHEVIRILAPQAELLPRCVPTHAATWC